MRIGKYKFHIEGTNLILTHSAGISFDMTPDEVAGLSTFINIYQKVIDLPRYESEPKLKGTFKEEVETESSNNTKP
ncbi:hypothetical protein KSD_11540 [Ktedonobacter sp. SOSP1-85]|uniref:hypothetical protein n=1 Tax=Ktedonobacter sp. SOSP1-85 TaxID=2778367 RepID=UPI0019161539|nr:hypothetical protein [Ktedonobacter sp. SOSP1-85]GHO73383.1 hypothetical protein KSD_11540 [Ktedonobacter sp. SOSP1-85]